MKSRIVAAVAYSALILLLPIMVRAQQAPPASALVPTPEPSPVLPVAPTVAPGYSAPGTRPTSAEIIGVTRQPFVGLSLDDAIGMALRKNPDLAVAASNTRIAGYQIRAVRGAYDVRFQIEPSVSHANTAPENAFFSGPNFGPIVQNTQSLQAGVSGQLPIGTQYSVGIQQTRIDNNTIINAFNPFYTASLNAQVSQPLLRGSFTSTRQQLQLATANQLISNAQAFTNVSTTISNVEDAYWDLVAAWRNVAIQEDALKQAIAQQHSNVRLAQRGAAAPIDAVESSTQVAIYQDNVFSGMQAVSRLQNELKTLVVDDPADPIWQANLVPTSSVAQVPNVPPLSDVLSTAMKNRPELQQVAAQNRQADIDLAYARNQLLPQVDLQMQYQGNGLAGNALPPVGGVFGSATPPPYLGGTYAQAYGNTGRFPTYSAGVLISTPIGNDTARANLSAAQEQQRIAKLQTVNLDQRLLFDVRNALQGYQSALSRLYAARKAREAAQAVFASEQRRFRNGVSTTFLVTQRQVELVQNEGRELQAQTDLNKAVVELQRADGTILSANNVTLSNLGQGAIKP